MIRMGRNSKPENNEPSYSPTPATPSATQSYGTDSSAASSRAVTDSESMARDIKEGRLSGFVGHGTILSGDTNFQAMLRVDGQLVGTVTSDSGTLLVGTNGQVDANVSVASAIVNGVINGDIIASEKIQLGRTARVVGNIQTPRIVIEDGAVFEGSCAMLKSREAVETRTAEAESARYQQAVTAIDEDDDDDNYLTSENSVVEDEDKDEDEVAEAAAL